MYTPGGPYPFYLVVESKGLTHIRHAINIWWVNECLKKWSCEKHKDTVTLGQHPPMGCDLLVAKRKSRWFRHCAHSLHQSCPSLSAQMSHVRWSALLKSVLKVRCQEFGNNLSCLTDISELGSVETSQECYRPFSAWVHLLTLGPMISQG